MRRNHDARNAAVIGIGICHDRSKGLRFSRFFNSPMLRTICGDGRSESR